MSADHKTDSADWLLLYQTLRRQLANFGREDAFRRADFWVDDSDTGFAQQKIYINTLELLRPRVVEALQRLVKTFPGCEIMVAVSIPGIGEHWPTMGLIIRAEEIVDGLQRRYFPRDFQNVQYKGSRPGTEHD